MANLSFRAAPRAFHSLRRGASRPTQSLRKPATPLFRRFLATPAGEQPRLRLGSTGLLCEQASMAELLTFSSTKLQSKNDTWRYRFSYFLGQ